MNEMDILLTLLVVFSVLGLVGFCAFVSWWSAGRQTRRAMRALALRMDADSHIEAATMQTLGAMRQR